MILRIKILLSLVVFSAAVCAAASDAPVLKPICIVLVGDSTVASYDKRPADKPDLTGWGQVFGGFFDDRVTVLNHAKSGRSTKSFIKEGLWKKALADKGDFIFIQFGHNDSHAKDGKPAVDPATDFPSYLRQYIDESRAAGAKPILVTPVARRTFQDGKIVTGLQPYADAMLKVGKEKGVPVIDLHAAAMRLFDRLGDAGSADLTASANDRTHFSRKGAEAMAGLVADSVRTEVPDLAPYLKKPVRTSAERPRMYFADTVSGRPFSKDPAIVKFQGRYLLYYSLPDYPNKPTKGWSIGIAASANLLEWKKICELKNSGEAEQNGFCSPGAVVIGDRIHLFYQTYGNARQDALCHAWSKDGIAFTRDPTNPVFRPAGSWNCGRAIDADVIVHEGRLLLYWATRDPAFKIQMLGVASAPLSSGFARDKWTQLNLDGPILKPELPWEGRCIEAAAMTRHGDRIYMFYGGNYNNAPQQIGVAVSRDGIHFTRLSDRPFLPSGSPGTWNSSESGHPFFFHDDDGKDYLFYQGNNDKGRTWYLSMEPIEWKDGKPILTSAVGKM